MNIRKKEKYYFISVLNEVFNTNAVNERNMKMHLTREFPTCFRITFYCGKKTITRHISFNTSFSLRTLKRTLLKEFPNTFKHVKKRKDRWNNPSLSFY